MINLLPPQYRDRHLVYSKLYGITAAYIIVTALVGVGAIGLIAYHFTLASQVTGKQSSLDNLTSQATNSSLTTQAGQIEQRMSFIGANKSSADYLGTLTLLEQNTPTNITLTGIKIDSSKTPVTLALTGTSPDRRTVFLYESKLASLKTNFNGVAVASLSQTTTINFSINLNINASKK